MKISVGINEIENRQKIEEKNSLKAEAGSWKRQIKLINL